MKMRGIIAIQLLLAALLSSACAINAGDMETITVPEYRVLPKSDARYNMFAEFMSDDETVGTAGKDGALHLEKINVTDGNIQSRYFSGSSADCLFVDEKGGQILVATAESETEFTTRDSLYEHYLTALDYDLNTVWRREQSGAVEGIVMADGHYFAFIRENVEFDIELGGWPAGDCKIVKMSSAGEMMI